jgi:hypothetical protein
MALENEDWFAPLKLKVPEEYTEPKDKKPEVTVEVSDPELSSFLQTRVNMTEDFFRSGVDLGSNIAGALIKDPINIVGEAMGLEEPVISDDVGLKARKALDFGLEQIGLGDVIDEQGEVTPTETLVGAALPLGAFVVGGVHLAGIRVLSALPTAIRYTSAGIGTAQLLSDPKENMYNVIEDLADIEITAESDSTDQGLKNFGTTMKPFVEYFAADEDDSTLELRAKLLAEEIPFAILGGFFAAGSKTIKAVTDSASTKAGRTLDDLTSKEKADYLKEAHATQSLQKPEAKIEYSETPQGVAQVIQQQSNPLKRFVQQVFTSRGYWTPRAFNAFEDSVYAQRQQVKHAENVSNRLQKSLDALAEESTEWGKEVTNSVQEALTTPLTFNRGATQQEKLDIIMEQFDIPETVARETLAAREMIDGLSRNIVGSSAVPDAIKEAVVENSGAYLRRSYRLYEDSGYKPSASAVHDAREYLIEQNLKQNPKMDYDAAVAQANDNINSILDKGDLNGVYEYFSKVRKVNTEILKGRKELPEPIRNLMGEIKEPSENIVLTVSKMSRLIETNKFFSTLDKMGNGYYIFDANDAARNVDRFNVKISGTNSALDGKYTTPEMFKAIKEQESKFISTYNDSVAGKLYKNFLTLKGTSQKMKTVYSHVTHFRNALGGMQFATANGFSPFSRSSKETVNTLINNIRAGGDEALDEAYEKYLRLGIINTNVRVNEFRQLLDTGYESQADTLLDKFGEKLQGYGIPKVLLDAPTNVYVATDDYFKITIYAKELETLKKAMPNEPLEVLEEEAANIVRNTVPNYDRVPKGIKTLRELPFGNFFSFPTEIVRTSSNILSQAAREINSGNSVLKRRGLKRVAGYVGTASAWGALANSSAHMIGFDEEKQKAAQVLSEAPWSKTSSRVWAQTEEGEVFFLDTQFYDSYNTVKEPFTILAAEIEKGQLEGKELEDAIISASGEALKKIMAPFAGEAILTSAITDITFAAISSDGKTADGKEIFTPGLDFSEKLDNMTTLIWESFKPGSVKSIQDLVEAQPNAMTGRPRATEADILNNVSGLRFQPFVPEESLMYAVNEYQFGLSDIVTKGANHRRTPEEVLNRYKNRQQEIYKRQQELYRKVDASRKIMGDDVTAQLLKEKGLSNEMIGGLFQNMFMPERIKIDYYKSLFEKTEFNDPEVLEKFVLDSTAVYSEMLQTPLNFPSDMPTEERQQKAQFSKGGEVSVPNAPKEPDERIDRMTGLPYNIQAGKAFIDVEDTETRALFSVGGEITQAVIKGLKEGKETFKGLKKTLDEYTDRLFKEEELDEVAANLEYKKEEKLLDFEGQGFDDVDVPSADVADFELDEYYELALKDLLSGGADAPVAPGTRITDFAESINPQRIKEMAPESDEMARLSELMDEIDPDMEIYRDIQEQVRTLRSKYSMLTQSLEGIEDIPPEAGPMKQFLTKRIEDTSLSDKGKEALAQAQTKTLANDPELSGLMDRLFKDMPEKAEEIKEPLDIDPVKRAEQVKTFVESSVKKEPVYRGISDFNEGEYDIAFAVPREIGAHVGTAGQANTILIKDVDPEIMKEQFTVASRGGEKTELKEIQDFFEENKNILEERPMPYTVSKGYVQIKNPLEIDTDFGTWNAAEILSNTDPKDFWDDSLGTLLLSARSQGVPDAKINELLDANLDSMIEKAKRWDKLDTMKRKGKLSEVEKRKTDMLQADINRQMRGMLEDMGFDSIKYKNTVESSLVGEDDYSYILFKPNQFKSVSAEKFDVNDPRFRKNMGGYIDAAFARNS